MQASTPLRTRSWKWSQEQSLTYSRYVGHASSRDCKPAAATAVHHGCLVPLLLLYVLFFVLARAPSFKGEGPKWRLWKVLKQTETRLPLADHWCWITYCHFESLKLTFISARCVCVFGRSARRRNCKQIAVIKNPSSFRQNTATYTYRVNESQTPTANHGREAAHPIAETSKFLCQLEPPGLMAITRVECALKPSKYLANPSEHLPSNGRSLRTRDKHPPSMPGQVHLSRVHSGLLLDFLSHPYRPNFVHAYTCHSGANLCNYSSQRFGSYTNSWLCCMQKGMPPNALKQVPHTISACLLVSFHMERPESRTTQNNPRNKHQKLQIM